METNLHVNVSNGSFKMRSTSLAEALSKGYISIAEIDLCTGIACVLKSSLDTELVGMSLPISKLVQRYAEVRTYPEDRNIILSLTQDYLETLLKSGNEEVFFEVRCVSSGESYIWVRIGITVLSVPEKKLLITTRSIHEDRMMQRIVELYVFNNMDYFILLDAKHDTYTMFSSKKQKGMPTPPASHGCYTKEMIQFNEKYVAIEDRARVTANMQIPHVIQMLQKEERYSFSSGGYTHEGKYRRTQVQYQYYDKSMGLILLTRIDITRIFMEEQEKHARLNAALRDAQHDALTNIYNRKAMTELISGTLESRHWNQAAFLFVDVDNFKMVNDTLGHQTGDKVLQFLARSIQDLAGNDGLAGRVGGDEFLLFLPASSGRESVEQCAGKICRVFESLPDHAAKKLPISCSVGISVYPRDGTDYETLVQKADQSLYTSKRLGKNMYYFYP